MARFKPSYQYDSCGSDVTFAEYVKYLNIHLARDLDPHVRPVAHRCDACELDYDVIGKMATFQADARYILKKVGAFGKEVVFKDMNTGYLVDYIADAVARAFELKEEWIECISSHAANHRLWRQLQIAGVIEESDLYPLSSEESNNMTVTEYLNLALAAFKRSTPSAKANKKETFLQGNAKVSLEDLEDPRAHYVSDFEMYDYEQRPAELFKEKRQTNFDFDYFDVLELK